MWLIFLRLCLGWTHQQCQITQYWYIDDVNGCDLTGLNNSGHVLKKVCLSLEQTAYWYDVGSLIYHHLHSAHVDSMWPTFSFSLVLNPSGHWGCLNHWDCLITGTYYVKRNYWCVKVVHVLSLLHFNRVCSVVFGLNHIAHKKLNKTPLYLTHWR